MIDTGDTAFVIFATALVMFMVPGLALFYGGMVRKKNILATLMHSYAALGVVTLIWILFGYSLVFGKDSLHLIGSLEWSFLKGVGAEPVKEYAGTIPALVFMAFQMMFAIITPALITGAFAERIRFKSYLLFIALWSVLVYIPIAHWVWGVGGWIRELGALDFAGGTVVHISSGAAALVAALVIGKRKGYGKEAFHPHSLPLTILGAGMLWFGWFGFNGGSALAANGLGALAVVVTHIAAAMGALGWIIAEWIKTGKPTTLGFASGAVAGLVGITPASGFVGPIPAVLIGLLAGFVCYYAVSLKSRLGYDDALDVVGVHGVGGTLGALLTGVFAAKAINEAGADGLLYGNASLLGIQAIAVIATWIYSAALTFVILKIIDTVFGLRPGLEEEEAGLDLTEHNEAGYAL